MTIYKALEALLRDKFYKMSDHFISEKYAPIHNKETFEFMYNAYCKFTDDDSFKVADSIKNQYKIFMSLPTESPKYKNRKE